MFDHPQVLAQELVVECEHASIGKYRGMSKALEMGIGESQNTSAPALGEHTEEVLARFGFREDEIASLRARGAIA